MEFLALPFSVAKGGAKGPSTKTVRVKFTERWYATVGSSPPYGRYSDAVARFCFYWEPYPCARVPAPATMLSAANLMGAALGEWRCAQTFLSTWATFVLRIRELLTLVVFSLHMVETRSDNCTNGGARIDSQVVPVSNTAIECRGTLVQVCGAVGKSLGLSPYTILLFGSPRVNSNTIRRSFTSGGSLLASNRPTFAAQLFAIT